MKNALTQMDIKDTRDAWKGHACKRIMTSTYATRVPERACTHLYMYMCILLYACTFEITQVIVAAFFVPFEFHFSRERAYIHLQKLSLHDRSRIHVITILLTEISHLFL